jgi:hypothetical protein
LEVIVHAKVLGTVLRFEKYKLKILPEKTRLLDFTKPREGQGKGNSSFTFLEFTHYWTKSRKGKWAVGRKTDSKRLRRAITAVKAWRKPVPDDREQFKSRIILIFNELFFNKKLPFGYYTT